MAKIRLKSKQWATFSSNLGTIKFKNGVSEDHVSSRDIDLIAAITQIETIDESGNVAPAGGAHRMAVERGARAPVEKALKPVGEPDARKEITPEDVVIKPKSTPVEKTDEASKELEKAVAEIEAENEKTAAEGENTPVKTYTRTELEEIADKDGIVGLRKIGEDFGVKSNSIESLMDKIEKSQPKGDE